MCVCVFVEQVCADFKVLLCIVCVLVYIKTHLLIGAYLKIPLAEKLAKQKPSAKAKIAEYKQKNGLTNNFKIKFIKPKCLDWMANKF